MSNANDLYKENELLKEQKEELLTMLAKIAYARWDIYELEKLLSKYGNYNDWEKDKLKETVLFNDFNLKLSQFLHEYIEEEPYRKDLTLGEFLNNLDIWFYMK